MGEKHHRGYTKPDYTYSSSLFFKLERKYQTVSFTVGHRDNKNSQTEGTLKITVDGTLKETHTLTPEMPNTVYTVRVPSNQQLIVTIDGYNARYTVFDIKTDVPLSRAHTYKDTVITKAAFAQEGITKHTCTVCGASYTSATPALTRSLSDTNIYLSNDTYVYTGSPIQPTVSVSYGSTDLVAGQDYTVSYSDNITPGKATIIISGAGYYTDAKSVTFTINPAKAKISSLKKGKKKFTVKWKKVAGASGYEVYYSGYTSGTKKVSAKKTSLTVKKLYKKKKYKVYVRAYKKVGSETLYGEWSKGKTVKTK